MPTYSAVTDIKILPIIAFEIEVDNGDESTTVHEWSGVIEKESSYKIDPVTQLNERGQPITVAYKMPVTIYIPQNHFETQHDVLMDMLDKPLVRWKISLGGLGNDLGYANAAFEVDERDEWDLCDHSLIYRREKIEWRPRMIIELVGVYSLDVFRDTTNKHFTEVSGF